MSLRGHAAIVVDPTIVAPQRQTRIIGNIAPQLHAHRIYAAGDMDDPIRHLGSVAPPALPHYEADAVVPCGARNSQLLISAEKSSLLFQTHP